MERRPSSADGQPPGAGDSPLWFLVLAGVLAGQFWLTLSLFGPDQRWQRLLDDQPIVSGRHPLHLYHGTLGARALLNRGSLCCYDPAFQAGYPKTPIFDAGSRPAELFLLLAGGDYHPAAYKIGVAAVCVLAPLVVALAALCVGLNRLTACLAAGGAVLIWWSQPCRSALEEGQIDLLLAALAALAQVGFLIRFDRAPGLLSWVGILVSGYLGWFVHPLFFALGLPLGLIYYLTVGARHSLVWHTALLVGLAGALAINGVWLAEWARSWWIQAPVTGDPQILAQRTVQSLWEAVQWGRPLDRALELFLGVLGLVGIVCFNQLRQRDTARLLGLGAAGFLALALAGNLWPPLERFGTAALAVPAQLFAVLPAVYALYQAGRLIARWTGVAWGGAGVIAAVLAGLGSAGYVLMPELAARFTNPPPLAIGLGAERLTTAEILRQRTTPEARILWEHLDDADPPQRWTPLLPLLTGRSFLGGLDPEGHIEHAYAGLTDGVLAGRPVRDWSDPDLEEFCRRYNVGWVVCRSPVSAARLRTWAAATQDAVLPTGWLFRIDRRPSYTLQGQARWLSADEHRIVLADVVPENGQVILSLHYHEGLTASPARVQVERAEDPSDPIDFVRLRLAAPAARLTLTWRP